MLARLYDLADQLYRLAPWDWMEESQVIGLRHPETGEFGYLSVMGAAGDHRCLALYLDEDAIQRFNLLQGDDPDDPELPDEDCLGIILESRQLQAVFETRSELAPHELAAIKQVGRRYRGDNWPAFRSFRPGYAPAPLNAVETVWLTHAIEQMLCIAPVLKEDPMGDFRFDPNTGEHDILTRECVGGIWRSTWSPFEGQVYEFPTPAGDPALLARIPEHQRLVDVECLFQLIPTPIGTKPDSRTFPYLVVSADAASGYVIAAEFLSVEQMSHAELIASVPNTFLRQWDKAGVRPASLRVATITGYSMLEQISAALTTPLRRYPSLPAIDRFLDSMPDFS